MVSYGEKLWRQAHATICRVIHGFRSPPPYEGLPLLGRVAALPVISVLSPFESGIDS